MSAFLDRGELVFEVNASRTGINHGLHEFECIQNTTEAGLSVSHDGQEVVDVVGIARVLAFHPLDLIAAGQGAVDTTNDLGHRVGGIQGLVGVHLTGHVGIASDLPAGEVNGFQAGLGLLHGLVAGQGTQAVDKGLVVNQVPELLGATLGQGVLGLKRATQTNHVVGRVAALDAAPAGIFRPVFLELLCFLFTRCHRRTP